MSSVSLSGGAASATNSLAPSPTHSPEIAAVAGSILHRPVSPSSPVGKVIFGNKPDIIVVKLPLPIRKDPSARLPSPLAK